MSWFLVINSRMVLQLKLFTTSIFLMWLLFPLQKQFRHRLISEETHTVGFNHRMNIILKSCYYSVDT